MSSCTLIPPTRSWTAPHTPQELIERAGELGHTALALTDHDSVGGAMELAMAARDSPVRAIFGAEVTVEHLGGMGGGEHRGGANRLRAPWRGTGT